MANIGIYDSGIGGLTTLATLSRALPACNFYYFADNGNMPFGTKTDVEIFDIVNLGLKKLACHSDITVVACNTASVTVNPQNAIKLTPDLTASVTVNPQNAIKLTPDLTASNSNLQKTLVLATPATLKHLSFEGGNFVTVATKELAVLIENQASICFKSRQQLNMSALRQYLGEKLASFGGATSIVLGCSHYIYAKYEISNILKNAQIFDGNDKVLLEVQKKLGQTNACVNYSDASVHKKGKIDFEFSGTNESEKYKWILQQLFLKNN